MDVITDGDLAKVHPPLSLTTDESLLTLVATGDTAALEVLYDRYAGTVCNLLLRILHCPATAEEITEETFWRVWQHAGDYVKSGSVSAWIFRIARNAGLDELRRRQRHPCTEDRDISDDAESPRQLEDPATPLLNQVWLAAQHQAVRQALAQLPACQRQVIELAYFEGVTQKQMAATLDTPLGIIKTRLHLGVQKLQVLLEEAGMSAAFL